MSEILSEPEWRGHMSAFHGTRYQREAASSYNALVRDRAALRALVGQLAEALERKCTCHHLPTLLNFHTAPNGDGTVTKIICGLSRDEVELLASSRSATGEKA
jgi:hypothetical protein